MYNLVDVILCDEQALNNVEALLSLLQIEARTAHDDIVAVVYEVADKLLEVKQLWAAIDQRDVVNRKRCLQGGILVERVENNARHSILLQDDDDTHTLAVRLIINV